MPKNTRQNIKQKFASMYTNLDWLEYHLLSVQNVYMQGVEEYGNDYTEHIAKLECLIQATGSLKAAIKGFEAERV